MKTTHVLIVEDELLIAKGLKRKLERLGYSVPRIVSSGEATIHAVEELYPNLDIILMDIVIRGDLDGINTAFLLREKFDIPIIYLTAYTDEDTLARAEETGSYGYLLKPFKEREIHATIKLALKNHQKALALQNSLIQIKANQQEKEQYLSTTYHDLRNPLTTIQMSAFLLEKRTDKLTPEKITQHFKRIQNSVDQMNQLLEDLLILQKVEAGNLFFESSPLPLIPYFEKIIDEFRELSSENHSLSFHSDCSNCVTHINQKLLDHIVKNLLYNAIKYSPQGGRIAITLDCNREEIWFNIQDQGIGISPDYQEKLFQPFVRAANVGTIQGTGLGLSIVKRAVDLQGGRIKVESKVNCGTCFTITLPQILVPSC
ncbi:response regulator [Spirulina subsalsa FACHB-351]|uniref:histidine kinase n=1 Tax=Spirulina subsalsa FACHB-351 TaxID=234711 RepID=A0ABT3L3G9_9CYAN|nr:ATP-binding protein [Spirulina subsalsa]MCW6036044.1 response regulator [Spirulina subsalsa FACHB-351]